MEYLAGFLIFFFGWLLLRFLLSASYASGFADGAWRVTNGGIEQLGELARPIDAHDLEEEINAESIELGQELNSRNFDAAQSKANSFGRRLVSRTWKLRGMLH